MMTSGTAGAAQLRTISAERYASLVSTQTTGWQVWDAALSLRDFLLSSDFVRTSFPDTFGKLQACRKSLSILELGSGTGFLGQSVAVFLEQELGETETAEGDGKDGSPSSPISCVCMTEMTHGGAFEVLKANVHLNAEAGAVPLRRLRAVPCDWAWLCRVAEGKVKKHSQMAEEEEGGAGPVASSHVPPPPASEAASPVSLQESKSEDGRQRASGKGALSVVVAAPVLTDFVPVVVPRSTATATQTGKATRSPRKDHSEGLGDERCPPATCSKSERGNAAEKGDGPLERSGVEKSSAETGGGLKHEAVPCASTLLNVQWDLIIGSDLVYSEEGARLLPRALAALLSSSPDAICLYAHTKHRIETCDHILFASLESNGLSFKEIQMKTPGTEDESERPPSPPLYEDPFPELRVAIYEIRVCKEKKQN